MARRNRRDPFNPFAPGASNKIQKKVVKQQPIVNKNVITTRSRKEQLEAMKRKIESEQKRKEAIKKGESKVEEPKVEEPKVEISKNEHSKLDDLKRRSDELAAKTEVSLPDEKSDGTLFSKPSAIKEKAIKEPQVKVISKPFRKTKRGGGRQPKQQKLSRRKQLEFRFDARAILDSPDVAEEHRSNLFGQIWAKGERIGTDSAIEYIAEKEQEGILSRDVSDKLEALLKSYSTKR